MIGGFKILLFKNLMCFKLGKLLKIDHNSKVFVLKYQL